MTAHIFFLAWRCFGQVTFCLWTSLKSCCDQTPNAGCAQGHLPRGGRRRRCLIWLAEVVTAPAGRSACGGSQPRLCTGFEGRVPFQEPRPGGLAVSSSLLSGVPGWGVVVPRHPTWCVHPALCKLTPPVAAPPCYSTPNDARVSLCRRRSCCASCANGTRTAFLILRRSSSAPSSHGCVRQPAGSGVKPARLCATCTNIHTASRMLADLSHACPTRPKGHPGTVEHTAAPHRLHASHNSAGWRASPTTQCSCSSWQTTAWRSVQGAAVVLQRGGLAAEPGSFLP